MLYLSNTGDSRALLIQIPDETTSTLKKTSYPLFRATVDHSWDLYKEQMRIIERGGRIERWNGNFYVIKYLENIKAQPLRVWLPDEERPGLAMTRSVGDHIVRDVGVICTPEVQKHVLNRPKYILIIGSDGIFEFMTNKEMSKYALDHQNSKASDVATRIVEISRQRWRTREAYIDDWTCQVIYIDMSAL